MVSKSGSLYICDICRLKFMEKQWAEKCEAWDKKYNSCNLDIAKHAVK